MSIKVNTLDYLLGRPANQYGIQVLGFSGTGYDQDILRELAALMPRGFTMQTSVLEDTSLLDDEAMNLMGYAIAAFHNAYHLQEL